MLGLRLTKFQKLGKSSLQLAAKQLQILTLDSHDLELTKDFLLPTNNFNHIESYP